MAKGRSSPSGKRVYFEDPSLRSYTPVGPTNLRRGRTPAGRWCDAARHARRSACPAARISACCWPLPCGARQGWQPNRQMRELPPHQMRPSGPAARSRTSGSGKSRYCVYSLYQGCPSGAEITQTLRPSHVPTALPSGSTAEEGASGSSSASHVRAGSGQQQRRETRRCAPCASLLGLAQQCSGLT